MKLGLSSFAFTWSIGWAGKASEIPMDSFALVKKAASIGAHVVQIADNLPLDSLSSAERASLRLLADSADVQIEVGTRGLFDKNLETYLEIAKEFSSPLLRIVTDKGQLKPTAEEIIEIVKKFRAKLEKDHIILAIENHDRFTSRILASIIRAVDSPMVGICLDTVNSFGAQEGPEHVIDTLGPFAVNLHLKDFKITRAWHSMGFAIEGTAAGEGLLNIPHLISRLRAFGRDVNAIIESWVTPEDQIEDTLKKEQMWAERGFNYLRSLIPG